MVKARRDFQLTRLPSGDCGATRDAAEAKVACIVRQLEVLQALPRTSAYAAGRLVGTTAYLKRQLRDANVLLQQLQNPNRDV